MKPYYEEAGIQIFHGDCREILPTLGPVDLVLTDPPYGVGKADWDTEFPSEAIAEIPGGLTALAIMPGVSNLLSLPVTLCGLPYRWTLSCRLLNGMTRGAFGFGNWIPCVVYAAQGISLHSNSQDFAEVVVDGLKPNHPSPKPLKAIRWMLSTLPLGTVVDPFMGSGTTLRAAKDLGRKAIGIDVCEEYCEIAAKRLAQNVLSFDRLPNAQKNAENHDLF